MSQVPDSRSDLTIEIWELLFFSSLQGWRDGTALVGVLWLFRTIFLQFIITPCRWALEHRLGPIESGGHFANLSLLTENEYFDLGCTIDHSDDYVDDSLELIRCAAPKTKTRSSANATTIHPIPFTFPFVRSADPAINRSIFDKKKTSIAPQAQLKICPMNWMQLEWADSYRPPAINNR